MKAILVLLILMISVVTYGRVVKGSTKVLQCTTAGGDCVLDTCDFGKQIPALSENAAGCKANEICCINLTVSKPIDPDCKGKIEGQTCKNSSMYYCGPGDRPQCMNKCEYCSLNFGTTVGKDICKNTNVFVDRDKANLHQFTCGCTAVECTQDMKAKGLCILGYCPSNVSTSSSYACCIK